MSPGLDRKIYRINETLESKIRTVRSSYTATRSGPRLSSVVGSIRNGMKRFDSSSTKTWRMSLRVLRVTALQALRHPRQRTSTRSARSKAASRCACSAMQTIHENPNLLEKPLSISQKSCQRARPMVSHGLFSTSVYWSETHASDTEMNFVFRVVYPYAQRQICWRSLPRVDILVECASLCSSLSSESQSNESLGQTSGKVEFRSTIHPPSSIRRSRLVYAIGRRRSWPARPHE